MVLQCWDGSCRLKRAAGSPICPSLSSEHVSSGVGSPGSHWSLQYKSEIGYRQPAARPRCFPFFHCKSVAAAAREEEAGVREALGLPPLAPTWSPGRARAGTQDTAQPWGKELRVWFGLRPLHNYNSVHSLSLKSPQVFVGLLFLVPISEHFSLGHAGLNTPPPRPCCLTAKIHQPIGCFPPKPSTFPTSTTSPSPERETGSEIPVTTEAGIPSEYAAWDPWRFQTCPQYCLLFQFETFILRL